MKRPAPVLALLNRARQKNRLLAVALDDALLDAAVHKRREERWRRTAFEMAPRIGPKAMRILLFQAQSEEIEDLDQIEEHT